VFRIAQHKRLIVSTSFAPTTLYSRNYSANKLNHAGEKQKRRLQALELYAQSHTAISQDEVPFSTPTSTTGEDVAGMLGIDSPIMGLPELLQHHSLTIPGIGINDLVSCDPSLSAAPSSRLASGAVPIYDEYIPSSNFQVDNVQNSSKSFQAELFSASGNEPTSILDSNVITPESSLSSSNAQQSHGQTRCDSAPNGDSHDDSEADSLLAQFLLQDDVTLTRSLLGDIRKHKINLRDVLRLGLQSLEGKSSSTAGSARVTENSLQQRAYCKSIIMYL
jgi:hypothetical protein